MRDSEQLEMDAFLGALADISLEGANGNFQWFVFRQLRGKWQSMTLLDLVAEIQRLSNDWNRIASDVMALGGVAFSKCGITAEEAEPYRLAVDEALVMSHLGIVEASDTYADAKRKLDLLLTYEAGVRDFFASAEQEPAP